MNRTSPMWLAKPKKELDKRKKLIHRISQKYRIAMIRQFFFYSSLAFNKKLMLLMSPWINVWRWRRCFTQDVFKCFAVAPVNWQMISTLPPHTHTQSSTKATKYWISIYDRFPLLFFSSLRQSTTFSFSLVENSAVFDFTCCCKYIYNVWRLVANNVVEKLCVSFNHNK